MENAAVFGPGYYWIKLQHAITTAKRLARSGHSDWRHYTILARSYKLLYRQALGGSFKTIQL